MRATIKLIAICLTLFININHLCAQTPELMLPIGHTAQVNFAFFSSDSKLIVSGSNDFSTCIWAANDGKLLHKLSFQKVALYSAELSTDNTRLLTLYFDNTLCLWDVVNGTLIKSISTNSFKKEEGTQGVAKKKNEIGSVYRFSSDNKSFVAINNYTAQIWDANNGELLDSIKLNDYSHSAFFSSDNKRLISISNKGISIWNLKNKSLVKYFKDVNCGPLFLGCVSSDNNFVVGVTSKGRKIRVWDVKSEKVIFKLDGHHDVVKSVAFSIDNQKLLTSSADNTARIWDIRTGKCLDTLIGHSGSLNNVSFNKSNSLIVTSSNDSTARIWDAKSGNSLSVLKGINSVVYYADFSFDSKWIVTASSDKYVRVWDAENGHLIRTLAGASKGINFSLLSPSGQFVFDALEDSTARMWEISTGRIKRLFNSNDYVNNASISLDEKHLFTSGSKAQVWDIASGKKVHELDFSFLKNDLGGEIVFEMPSSKFVSDIKLLTATLVQSYLWDINSGKVKDSLRIQINSTNYDKKLFVLSVIEEFKISESRPNPDNPDEVYPFEEVSKASVKIFDLERNVIVSKLDSFPLESACALANNLVNKYNSWKFAFSLDNKYVAYCDYDTIYCWDVSSGKLLQKFKLNTSAASDSKLTFSENLPIYFSGDNLLFAFVDSTSYVENLSRSRYPSYRLLCGLDVTTGINKFSKILYERVETKSPYEFLADIFYKDYLEEFVFSSNNKYFLTGK